MSGLSPKILLSIVAIILGVASVGCALRFQGAVSLKERPLSVVLRESGVARARAEIIEHLQARGYVVEKRTEALLVFGHYDRRAKPWHAVDEHDAIEKRPLARGRDFVACEFKNVAAGVSAQCYGYTVNRDADGKPYRVERTRSYVDRLRLTRVLVDR